MKQLSKQYNPKEFEGKIYKFWQDKNLFNAEVCLEKKPYAIVIPPPNITGILHMGHALNNTIQDILIRYKKMKGYEPLWMPGTDHAGIATQNVVERKLAKDGKKRLDLGRGSFVNEVWRWQKEYGGTIIEQLKRLGASCDWRRERFTMDDGLSEAVLEVFVRLYDKGLIYRGNYIINWCPRCQTALSDEEAEHRELDGNLYYIRYPLKLSSLRATGGSEAILSQIETYDCHVAGAPRNDKGAQYITVATTRPETMLGDTGLAVNPNDERYKDFIGGTAVLPIINREIHIIADDMVDPDFGTGVVKITPAHDPNDFHMGKRHGLEQINIMHPDGALNENAGDFEGMDRFKAREALIALLKEKNLLEKTIPHKHAVGHCYRCHTIVEPCLSKQWFVKMKPLAEPAIDAVKDGKIKFYPDRWEKVYLNWMDNIRDWCISRQIWWGHRIPVYYCKKCQEKGILKSKVKSHPSTSLGAGKSKPEPKTENQKPQTEPGMIVSKVRPKKCPDCGCADIVQDPDVLDTWFSSWLWPFSTFGWPFKLQVSGNRLQVEKHEAEFKYFYPTSCLVTAQEIIFFWVARMIMAGIEFCKEIPFRDVYIHGTVRDDKGTKMSKSLGNTIDPVEIIDKYGADALRFSIISITAAGQDVFLSKDRFESGRNFANKIWNVSRFLMMNLKEPVPLDINFTTSGDGLSIADKWILICFNETLHSVEKALNDYRFNDSANLIYEFIWHKYCDWYIEIAKANISHTVTQYILLNVLKNSLKMLHPFMPFLTEAIWQEMQSGEPIICSAWPEAEHIIGIDDGSARKMEKLIKIISSIRNIRAEMAINPKERVGVILSTEDKDLADMGPELDLYASRLANTHSICIQKLKIKPKLSAASVLDFCEVFVLLEGIIDINKERERLGKSLIEAETLLQTTARKLSNKLFISRAPRDIIRAEAEKEKIIKQKIERIQANILNLT